MKPNRGHVLRARALIHLDDPRINHALDRMRHKPASPDEAYWQAALHVAQMDARRELARRQPVAYRTGYALGCLTLLAAPAALAWLLWWLLS